MLKIPFKKSLNNITIGTTNIALLVFLALFIVYTLFWPITPAVYKNLDIQNKGQIYAGQTLNYSIDACRKVGDGVITTITRSLVSTTNKKLLPISLSTDTVANPARCTHTNRSVLLPYSMPDGNYELVVRGVYAILPIRKPIAVQITSKSFSVKTPSIATEIQSLIDANNILQSQLKSNDTTTVTTVTPKTSTNGTSNTTNNSNTNNSTTNNTTTNNNSTGSTGTSNNTPSKPEDTSLLQGIINALGGGISLHL